MKLSLVVTQGTQAGKGIPITKAEFIIGRDAQCNLRPASQHVSKKHCALRTKGDRVFVEDFGSTNGTFINDEQLKGERELRDGDRLRIGPLDFIVKLEGAADKPTHVEKETVAPQPVKTPGAPARAPAPAAAAPKPAAPAPAKPAPAAKGGADAGEHLDEDAIGSMLLSLSDDKEGEQLSDSDSFASGSTLMQVLKPEEMEQLQNATDKTPYRPKASNQGTGANTSQAAKAILEKYRRRPKT
jgi:pSer/pThr/pTyr-binding forkhead associated (FHA) protein